MKRKELFIMLAVLAILLAPGCAGKDSEGEAPAKEVLAPDVHGRTPLHYAALRGRDSEVKQWLEKGADGNAADRYGFTPLHYAARRGHAKVVKSLLAASVDLNPGDHYRCTPLHHAASGGRRDAAVLLVKAGADTRAKDKNNETPAHLAHEAGFNRLADLFNPYLAAIKKGDLETFKRLLTKNPGQLNHTDWAGRSLLHHAYHFEKDQIIHYLKEQGAVHGSKDKYGNRPEHYSAFNKEKRTGVNHPEILLTARIDNIVYENLHRYDYVAVGLVSGGKVVFTRAYGNSGVNKDHVYASTSKAVTATIIMRLLEQGKIRGLDDNIWEYAPRYKNSMPARFADSPLTIRHLLMYKSGVPHNNEPTWKNGKLNLKFKPGASDMYTTPGYGILGHVIEGAAGMPFDRAVKNYIGKPVGGASFWAEKVFIAPGARIHSTVYDMALLLTGMVNHKYVSRETLVDTMLQHHVPGIGIGWVCDGPGTPDVTARISGANGARRAFMIFKPGKKIAVALFARTKNKHFAFQLNRMGKTLLDTLEK
jgi:hypothetical protein